jgi:hypothetical protein
MQDIYMLMTSLVTCQGVILLVGDEELARERFYLELVAIFKVCAKCER